ncbi:MAG: DMT family transporter [Spirulinaceae cyanobacterium]
MSLIRKRNLLTKIPGQLYLWIAVVIFGASGAVTRALTQIGEQHSVDGSNPISLCNVLFVGNLCALLVLIIISWGKINWHSFQELQKKDWLILISVAVLSGGLAPAFLFDALGRTQVNNVILISRIEPPLVLALSIWLLGERVNKWQVSGSFVALFGVLTTVFYQSLREDMMSPELLSSFGRGEIFTALGAIASGIAIVISKLQSNKITLVINNLFRTALGTIVFFILALLLYGSHHFMQIFSPFLWQWMLVYGTVIVVIGQSCWLTGLRKSPGSTASVVSSFTPVAGMMAAYFILGEAPTAAQYLGGSIIMAGIFLGQIGNFRKSGQGKNSQQEAEKNVGFKGI